MRHQIRAALGPGMLPASAAVKLPQGQAPGEQHGLTRVAFPAN